MKEYHNMDFYPSLKGYHDKYFDLAIIDPPQGNGEAERIASKSGKKGQATSRGYYHAGWDNERWPKNYFNEIFRVSKNQIIWCSIYYTDILPVSRGWIYWDKLTTGNFGDGELAWTSFNQAIHKVTFMWNGMMQGKSIKNGHLPQQNKKLNEKRIHPTQKPQKLYEYLLKRYAQPGDIILDPAAGSASSLCACEELGFEYVGFEIDPVYFKKSMKRLMNIKNQLKLWTN